MSYLKRYPWPYKFYIHISILIQIICIWASLWGRGIGRIEVWGILPLAYPLTPEVPPGKVHFFCLCHCFTLHTWCSILNYLSNWHPTLNH